MKPDTKEAFKSPVEELAKILLFWAIVWGGAFFVIDAIWLTILKVFPSAPIWLGILIGIFGILGFVGLSIFLTKRYGDKITPMFHEWALWLAAIVGAVIGYYWHIHISTNSHQFAFRMIAYENCKQISICRDKTEKAADYYGLPASFSFYDK